MKVFLLFTVLGLLVIRSTEATTNIEKLKKLEGTLEDLKDGLKSLMPEEKSLMPEEKDQKQNDEVSDEATPYFDFSTNQKRDDDSEYLCSFDGECTSHFTKESDNAAMAWKRKISHGHINDRRRPGSGFMMAELRYIRDKKQYSTLTSGPMEVQQAEQCGEFYYYIYGNQQQCDYARFLVTLECEGEEKPTELFRTTGSYGERKWNKVRVNINKTPGAKCKTTWRVSRGLANTHSYVAVDDIKMSMGRCRDGSEPEPAEAATCSFDSLNPCDWKISGPVPPSYSGWGTRQSSTGPDGYFGYGTYPHGTRGHYLYLDSRTSQYKGKSLILRTPILKSEGPKCMKVALSMYGKDMGSVEAFIVTNGTEEKVFGQEGNKNGNSRKWFDTGFSLPSGSFEVKIKATIGNGTKSDIAIDNIAVQDGACKTDKTLSHCKFDEDASCLVTNDQCPGNISKEFKIDDVFKPTRSRKATTIERLAKDWTVSVDIKLDSKTNGWTNLFHFTDNGNCCGKGDRSPAVFIYSQSSRMLIQSQHHSSGNIELPLQKWANLKMQQKKETDGSYYFYIYLDNVQRYKRRTYHTAEYQGVKVYTSDPWYNVANAEMKNFHFKNGNFEICNPVCNFNVESPEFVRSKPTKLTFSAERSLARGTLLTTLPSLEKEWKVSLDVKLAKKTGGWTSILHATNRHNCCSRGDRIPAIFVFSNSYRLHMTTQLGWSGNSGYNNIFLKQNQYTNMVMQQIKDNNGAYRYQIITDGTTRYNVTQSRPSTYTNVKYYLSDPWHNTADAKAKNIVIENLVSAYPCPGMCKGRRGNETIDGKSVATMTYDTETCSDKAVRVHITTPQLLRYGCLEMMFKTYGSRCYVNLSNDIRRLQYYRPKNGQWVRIKRTLSQSANKVGIDTHINQHCTKITATEIKLSEGTC